MPKYSCNDSEASGWRDVFDLSTDKKISYMIEDLSAWVVIKRFLIVVDNVIAAGLFAFFSVWINVYLGLEGYVEDFGSSVSMMITDIRLNLLETLLYFSLYLVLLWRSPEKIEPMSLDVYLKKYMPIALAILLVIVLGGYLACRRLMVERMGCADGNYPFIPSIIRWTILSTLFYYRHFILSWLATALGGSRE